MKIHLFDKSSDFTVYPAGAVVFNAGDKGDCMYAVISGEVEIILNGKVIDTIGASSVFGEMALVEDKPRSASAIVKAEAKLVKVDRNRFLFMVQQTPFFALHMLSLVTERLRAFMAQKA